MPYADLDRRREYARQWIAERRAEWFKGKACAQCDSTENLELDHLDPKHKITHRIWSWSAVRREAELAKCRVLCGECHKKKSAAEHPKGEEAPQAKLTEEQVREILSSGESHRALGRCYNVDEATIRRIRKGSQWKYLGSLA